MSIKINVDPAQLEASATKIETKCASYEKQYRQLFQTVEELKNGWKGKDNLAFVQQIQGFEQDFVAMKNLMQEYANFLRMSAKAYRNTQNERVMQARKLIN